MIIHQTEIERKGNEVIVTARVETSTDTPLPKTLWYRFPIEYEDAISDRSDGFLTGLFLLGMHLGEDMEIRGAVSPMLAKNMKTIGKKYILKLPKYLDEIDYQYHSIEAISPSPNRNIHLTSFSGGSDSFYALWSHLNPKITDHPIHITHALFLLGYDIFLKNNENYQGYTEEYFQLLGQKGIRLIPGSTNIYDFFQFRVPWTVSNTPNLYGAAMILGNGVSEYTKPGNYDPDLENPKDPESFSYLFSTESLKADVHAIELERSDKIIRLLDWDLFQEHFRTCIMMGNDIGERSCNKCVKCLNTALLVSLHGKQAKFPTIYTKFNYFHFINLILFKTGDIRFFRERVYYQVFQDKKRVDLIFLYWMMYPIGIIKYFIMSKVIHIIPKSMLYSLKNMLYPKNSS